VAEHLPNIHKALVPSPALPREGEILSPASSSGRALSFSTCKREALGLSVSKSPSSGGILEFQVYTDRFGARK
jgi:hypothetical protein